MAADVEVALFQHGGGVTAEYKAKYRSLSFNLKDANNPDLRRRVLSGEVAAQVRQNHLSKGIEAVTMTKRNLRKMINDFKPAQSIRATVIMLGRRVEACRSVC